MEKTDLPRTLLGQLIRARTATLSELCDEFHKLARDLGERATLTPRHLQRLASGARTGAMPTTRRVLEAMWDESFVRLIGPPRTPRAGSPAELGRHTFTATSKPSTSRNKISVLGGPEEFDIAAATNDLVNGPASDSLDVTELQPPRASPTRNSPPATLLASIPHNFSTEVLSGFWVTSYEYDSTCHADISQVIPQNDRRVTIKNYPPDPRVEGLVSSFRNEIEAELANRHLIGYWKNVNDAYYFGSIHLAVLPGETVMEGYYTCFLGDIQVVTERWKWVRLDLEPLSGIELSQVVLQEPRLIHALVERHSQHDMPLALAEVTEGI